MGLLSKILVGVGVIGAGGLIVKAISDNQKREHDEEIERERLDAIREAEDKRRREIEEQRRNTPFYFDGLISMNEFYSIVRRQTKHIKRLQITVDGPIIYGLVRSQSGISTWNFKLDFNDFGALTGRYWMWNDNPDSDIPENIANRIQEEIKKII